jgi:hypothetical protein
LLWARRPRGPLPAAFSANQSSSQGWTAQVSLPSPVLSLSLDRSAFSLSFSASLLFPLVLFTLNISPSLYHYLSLSVSLPGFLISLSLFPLSFPFSVILALSSRSLSHYLFLTLSLSLLLSVSLVLDPLSLSLPAAAWSWRR